MLPDLDRRQFLGLAATGALVALRPSLLDAAPAWRIGVLAPDPSTRDEAARAALDGLRLGQEESTRTARLFGRTVEFIAEDLAPDTDAAQAADRMIAGGADALITVLDDARVREMAAVVIDQECLAIHLLAAPGMPQAEGAGPWNLHLAPRPEARAEAVLAALHEHRTMLDARTTAVIVGDGIDDAALAGRADRAAAAAAGGEPLLPSATLPRSPEPRDAEVVFVAARDPGRVAALVATLGGAAWPGLLVDLFGSTEHLRPTDLPARLMRADSWIPDLERYGGAQLNDRFRARFGADAGMRGPAWAGWFAAKALAEAALRTSAAGRAALASTVRSARFDGHQGRPLAFAADGSLAHPLHVVSPVPPVSR